MVKKIAVYGRYDAKVPVKQRYWIKRKDGVIQRYWKIKHGSFKKVEGKGRYEFHGVGRDLYKAVVKAQRYMPKGFVDVPAEKFVEYPERHGVEGEWVEYEVES
jgi:hypothetical protein